MGNYNPQAPVLLGEQWVPIRSEDLVFSPSDSTVELGHAFTLTTSRQLSNGRFYVNELPSTPISSQVGVINVYPYGMEAETGPVQQVVIPCNNGGVTGSGSPGLALDGASSVAEALARQGDGKRIRATFAGTTATAVSGTLAMFFAANQYPQLQGKRILNVSLEYTGWVGDRDALGNLNADFVSPNTSQPLTTLSMSNNAGLGPASFIPSFSSNTGSLEGMADTGNAANGTPAANQVLSVINLGDVNSLNDFLSNERPPWRYSDLQRFEASNANRAQINIVFQVPFMPDSPVNNGVEAYLEYAALRVTYCEETRVAAGGQKFLYTLGANQITMRDMSGNANPILPAGQYSAVLTFASAGDTSFGASTLGNFPTLNAARQLYALTSHPGVQVTVPFPLQDHLGETFSRTTTMVLPQISLHATGGVLTEPHVYGSQIAAQVYGSNVAQQTIYDDVTAALTAYPQVRFYARRFGLTTVPLTLSSTSPTVSGSSVSIAPGELDLLPEIVDGWREVTLRFPATPSMGGLATDPVWQWSAAGELAGNRWEVLGACAPAISGTPGNNFNQVPLADRLGAATYQPPAGIATSLSWIPQGCGSPYVTGAAPDPNSDAMLLFSQDPPTVTGLTLTQLTQTVTGIGLNCGSIPCCIPSGIGYNRLSWSAAAIAASGFGSYELQRFDAVTGQFQTIMLTTAATAVTGTLAFNDFEARVGLQSVYRIRVNNLYNFAGSYSAQVSGAPPTPGVSGGCADMTGALIFTSNAAQQGNANLAYIMQWGDDTPSEVFGLPEAGDMQFQRFYGRDGAVAFHGTERGLETFSRSVLLNGGAISLPSLADGRGIRDLGWANYPYVCVRDDLGNRWYAAVQVPTITVQNNRQSYMAALTITETTQTPYAVSGS